jgi:hypothetical protein
MSGGRLLLLQLLGSVTVCDSLRFLIPPLGSERAARFGDV